MKQSVLLPAQVPLFSTYHYQVIGGVAAAANSTYLNWYYNNCIQLQCGKVFLRGCPTPHLNVPMTEVQDDTRTIFAQSAVCTGGCTSADQAHAGQEFLCGVSWD